MIFEEFFHLISNLKKTQDIYNYYINLSDLITNSLFK